MNSHIADLRESLLSGVNFIHSSNELALDRLDELEARLFDKDPIDIAVIGDPNIDNVASVLRHVSTFLKYWRSKLDYRILIGNTTSVDKIVQRACLKSGIDFIKFDARAEDHADGRGCQTRIIDNAHVVLVIADKKSNATKWAYNYARDNGRLVTRRVLRGAAAEVV